MTTEICAKELCTGCGACASVCPRKCITLQPNPQGHLFPHIDTQSCVNCNLCRKACPVNTPVPMHQPQACYAAWAKDEKDRITSSSGAASSVFASHVISNGGIVYGAALQNNQIQHIRVIRKEDLGRLKGSKYVYSYAADVYPQIKEDLATGKTVLFTGTPCQNAAVYNLVGENPNLILVNLICHGVPSMQMLSEHLRNQTKTTFIKSISFRCGNQYVLDTPLYHSTRACLPDCYITLFKQLVSCRSSCSFCSYAKPERCGDITIGDFWGLGKHTPFEGGDIRKGCSVIIINTEKGKSLLTACQYKLQLFEREYQEAVDGNSQLRSPVAQRALVNKFNKYYPKYSFNVAAWLTIPRLLGKSMLRKFLTKYTPAKRIKQSLCKVLYRKNKKL